MDLIMTKQYDNTNGVLCFLMIKSKRNHTQTTEATLMLTELNIDQGVEENCQDGDEILILVIDQERGYSTNNGGRPILMTPSSHSPTTPDKSDYYDKDWYDEYRELVVKKLLDVTAKKNNDYTTGESATNPFANFDRSTDFGVHPLTGLCIRMQDKFQRAMTFAKDGKLEVIEGNDQVEDIFLDLMGYSLLALGMLERDKQIKKHLF